MFVSSSSGTDKLDKRVSCLLSSMLNINEPADLIRAAAAFVRRSRQ